MSSTPRNVAELLARGPTHDLFFFWGHTPKAAGVVDKSCLSQWYPAPFVIDGVSYATAEHWMMASKARTFGDDEALGRILATSDPHEAKKLGRTVRNFDGDRWTSVCFDLVVAGNVAKFGQDEALRRFLVDTGSSVLVEAAPRDTIWGIGLAQDDERAHDPRRWRGQNLLGFALMEARARLANSGG